MATVDGAPGVRDMLDAEPYRMLHDAWREALADYPDSVEDGLEFAPIPGTPRTEGTAWRDIFGLFAWETRPATIRHGDGSIIFSEPRAEFPSAWREHDRNIIAQKYFFGDHEQGFRETSLKQLVARVSLTIATWAARRRTFRTIDDARRFLYNLIYIQLSQMFSFNSPVYFNVGIDIYGLKPAPENYVWVEGDSVGLDGGVAACPDANRNPQISACFIQKVTDDMQAIMRLATAEAFVFKRGSGTGTDLSPLRSRREKLSGGGRPSGPLSFMRIYDAIAGVVQSGGKTRRAAKMQTLLCDHPDILEFIDAKADEERKAQTLIEGGYASDLNGEAYRSVFFQNCNMSVRVTDEFMRKAVPDSGLSDDNRLYPTIARTTGETMDALFAPAVLDRIADRAHFCGDPGMQFDDTINAWHTVPNHSRINSSNPCIRRGSRLLTDAGWTKIEEIVGRDDVKIFDGVGFILGSAWRTGSKPIVRLHANSGETIDVTADHRIYTTDGWVEAGQCEGKTVPRVLPNVGSTGSSVLPRAITGASCHFYNHAAIDLMEALGFLQGDGGLREGIITIYLTPDKDGVFVDETVLPILQDIAANKGELEYKASPLGDSRHGYVISRNKLSDWLAAVGFSFRPLPERVLPGFVWGVKQNAQAAFLRGLFGANGNILKDSRTAVNLVSTCREMLGEVQLLLRSMGIVSSVRVHNKAQEIEWENGTYRSREAYHLEITHQHDIALFARLIGFPQEVQRSRLRLIVKEDRADKRDGGFAKRAFMDIVRVEELGIEDDVYDFRAPTTSMGLCNGLIIHNCSEYLHVDDSACNLASLNPMRLLDGRGHLDVATARQVIDTAITAMETMVDEGSYPTPEIALNSHRLRPLGLGYCNVGAFIMSRGWAYDSAEARVWDASLTHLITGRGYRQSALLALRFGAFAAFEANREPMEDVISKHSDACSLIESGPLRDAALDDWSDAESMGRGNGFRNSQISCIAPTGCVTGDTLVLTSRGLLPIAALGDPAGAQWQDIDFQVARESTAAVATRFYVNGVREIYGITTGDGNSLRATGNHQVRVIDENGFYAWKRMDQIRIGDYVARRLGGHEQLLGAAPLIPLDRCGNISLPGVLDERIAEILGFYEGNGYVKAGGGLHLVINDVDEDLISRFTDAIGKAPTREQRAGCFVLNFYDRSWVRWFDVNGFGKDAGNRGEGAASATIPEFVLRSRTSVLRAFLRGLFTADGTVTENRGGTPVVELDTVSDELAARVMVALESLGIRATRGRTDDRRSAFGARPVHRVRLSSVADCARFADKVGFASNRKQNFLIMLIGSSNVDMRSGDRISHRPLLDDFRSAASGLGAAVRADIAVRRQQGAFNTHWARRLIAEHAALGDTKIARLLGLGDGVRFVRVESAGPVGIEPTFDISVPEFNTYTAGGFLVHNTIAFFMGADTTGIEPEIALVKYKHLAGRGVVKIVNGMVPTALAALGYNPAEISTITNHIKDYGTVQDVNEIFGDESRKVVRSGLKNEHLNVFDCAFPPTSSGVTESGVRWELIDPPRSIPWDAHIRMVAAAQSGVSGAISKTINLPSDATVKDIRDAYVMAWKLGCKAVAVYRDGCKGAQPVMTAAPAGTLTVATESGAKVEIPVLSAVFEAGPVRRRLPATRSSVTHKFSIVGHEGYIHVGLFEDGTPGEVFIDIAKNGSTVGGLMGALGVSLSLALQYGVPVAKIADKLSGHRFEPAGITQNPDIPFATSIIDYIGRWLGCEFIPGYRERVRPVRSDGETPAQAFGPSSLDTVIGPTADPLEPPDEFTVSRARLMFAAEIHGQPCPNCGSIMVQQGP
jgi:ribonucleoside-diphosphate reductase alpha chain